MHFLCLVYRRVTFYLQLHIYMSLHIYIHVPTYKILVVGTVPTTIDE